MEKIKCEICGKEMDITILGRHVRISHGISSLDYAIKYLKHHKPTPLCKCGCGQEVGSWKGIRLGWPIWVLGHNKTNPEKISQTLKKRYKDGMKPWNKDLTKETDLRIKKVSENLKGNIIPQKTRQKISRTVKTLHKEGLCYGSKWRQKISYQMKEKTPWKTLGHHNKSSQFELLVEKKLFPLGFKKEIEQPTPKGMKGTYSIDFGRKDLLIGIELDGVQHLHPDQKLKDRKKDIYLESLGWSIYRFPFVKGSEKEAHLVYDLVRCILKKKIRRGNEK